MNPTAEANPINLELEDFYSTKLELWKKLRAEQARDGHCLSIPLFLKVSGAYLSARPRILFVGQETHGWWREYQPDEIHALTACKIMDFYEEKWPVLYGTYKSPYWQSMRTIATALGVNDPPRSFLFSNMFPCDLDARRAPTPLLETLRDWKLLPKEIGLLKPDHIIFFCGSAYSYNLQPYFGVKLTPPLSGTNPLVKFDSPDKTWKGHATYHPAYLWRSRNRGRLDEIVASIKADAAT